MRILYRSLIILLTALLFSCAQLQFPEFTVDSCDFSEENVTITFSAQPNEYTFIKAFSIKEDSTDITGTFTFDDCKVIFYPDNGIRPDYLYDITISTDAEDVNGNSLARRYETSYTTREGFERPYIKSVTPQNDTDSITQIHEIIFEFSKPVDVNTFRNAFSINPSVDYIITTENDDTVIKVSPVELLKKNTRYEITISTKLADKNRNFLLNEFKTTFINNNDTQIPEYSLYWNDGTQDNILTSQNANSIPNDVELTIEFDEPIDINYVMSYIEIQPSLSITVTPDKIAKETAKITFSDDVEWGQHYTLKILKGLKDLCGNEIKTDQSFEIVFDSEKHRPVTLEKAFINLFNASAYDEIANYTTLTFPTESFPTTNAPISTAIYAVFNISEEAANISALSVMNAFSTTFTNSCFNSITAKTVAVLTETQVNSDTLLKNAYDTITITNGGKLCVVKIGIEVINSGSAAPGMLTIDFDKGIKDSLGNVLKTDCEYHINKQ